ncbi:PIG-L deacetylase family protein [Rhabdothermincola sp.]|uniref:PIG-L deacetylase family protein n=1 Tax=Rhabdothermincola sp. TaxID=2820405 RepID=UPI002FE3EF69
MRPADLHVPDGSGGPEALARTTDLGVVAHPDDLELLAVAAIGQCAADEHRWFTGIVCTDGAGSARSGQSEGLTAPELVAARREEQIRAADLGGYSAVVLLGRPSGDVRSPEGFESLVGELAALLERTRPVNVYTHNLADKHPTHVAVGCAVVRAIRSLAPQQRPARLVGCEGWRDLDWLGDHEKVRLDVTPFADLAEGLMAVFRTQIEGGKRFDLAAAGRRRANAVFDDPRGPDAFDEVTVAMDLAPLIVNDDLDPVTYVTSAIDRFRADVDRRLRQYFA